MSLPNILFHFTGKNNSSCWCAWLFVLCTAWQRSHWRDLMKKFLFTSASCLPGCWRPQLVRLNFPFTSLLPVSIIHSPYNHKKKCNLHLFRAFLQKAETAPTGLSSRPVSPEY